MADIGLFEVIVCIVELIGFEELENFQCLQVNNSLTIACFMIHWLIKYFNSIIQYFTFKMQSFKGLVEYLNGPQRFRTNQADCIKPFSEEIFSD